jgi:hypothetical protein
MILGKNYHRNKSNFGNRFIGTVLATNLINNEVTRLAWYNVGMLAAAPLQHHVYSK